MDILKILVLTLFSLLCPFAQSAPLSSNDNFIPLEYIQLTAEQILSANFAAQNDSSSLSRGYRTSLSLVVRKLGVGAKNYSLSVETIPRWLAVFDKDFVAPRQLSPNTPLYDGSASSSARNVGETFHLNSDADKYEGNVFEEDISYFGFSRRQYIGSIRTWSGFGGQQFPLDGILGLGWDRTKKITREPSSPPVINAMEKGKILAYQIQLSPTESILSLGAENSCGQSTALYRMTEKTEHAIISMASVSFGRYELYPDDNVVFFDSGYGQILLPPEVWRSVQRDAYARWDNALGLFTVDCDANLPDFVFRFTRPEHPVWSKHYVVDIGLKDGRCAFAVERHPTAADTYVLGVPFFRAYCVHFNLAFQRIGLKRNPDFAN